MDHDETGAILATLNTLECLMDGNPLGITGSRQTYVSALLRELGGAREVSGRLHELIRDYTFAVRGCYEASNQFLMLVEILRPFESENAPAKARRSVWKRAHEALVELREELQQYRRGG